MFVRMYPRSVPIYFTENILVFFLKNKVTDIGVWCLIVYDPTDEVTLSNTTNTLINLLYIKYKVNWFGQIIRHVTSIRNFIWGTRIKINILIWAFVEYPNFIYIVKQLVLKCLSKYLGDTQSKTLTKWHKKKFHECSPRKWSKTGM